MRSRPTPLHRACALFATLALTSGCHAKLTADDAVAGDGVSKTETRDVAPFQSIEMDGVAQLELTTGPLGKLSIRGDENLLAIVSTTVTDGKLVIKETKPIDAKTPIAIAVTAPGVTRIEVNGAGSVRATGLAGSTFALASSGASSADLSGQVDRVQIDVAGAGQVRASTLVAKDARVAIAGAGAVEVNATDKLKADVAGLGSVKYRGSPVVEKSVAGIGTVKPL